MSTRRVGLAVLLVGLAAFAAIAVLRVPWHPVPGGALPAVPAREVFSGAQLDQAESYAGAARLWSRLSLAVGLLVAVMLGLTRVGRALVRRLPGPWWVRVVLAVLVSELAGRVLTLPFAVLLRRRQLAEGLSDQSWRGFARDLAMSEAVTVVVTSLGLLLLLGCVRRWRRAWPAVAGGLFAALVLGGSYAYPVVVEPLFNDFHSLQPGQLRSSVLGLARAEGVHVDDVLVADASRRTTTLNAYVSGFGSTRRVVLYDNLVAGVPRDEALSVVAHELGHAKYDDVLTGSLLGAAGALAAVGLLGVLLGRRPGDVAGDRRSIAEQVPLVLALLAIGTVLAMPVENGISRRIETRADVTALAVTHDAPAFVRLQRQLALRSLSDPTPAGWSQWWFGSHPTVLERVALARRVVG